MRASNKSAQAKFAEHPERSQYDLQALTNSTCRIPSSVSRAWKRSSGVLSNWGICNHYTVELSHSSAPQEVHHVLSLLRFAGVYEVVRTTCLHEHPVALAYVYKAHRERA